MRIRIQCARKTTSCFNQVAVLSRHVVQELLLQVHYNVEVQNVFAALKTTFADSQIHRLKTGKKTLVVYMDHALGQILERIYRYDALHH